jgi:hypothetical protein
MSIHKAVSLENWSLFNERSRIQIDDLTSDQAWGVVAAEDPKHRHLWLVWHTGLTDWKSVSDFDESSRHLSRAATAAYTFPAVPDLEDQRRAEAERRIGEFELDDSPTDIGIDTTARKDLRKNRRYLQRYKVEINLDGNSFTTHTVDISLSGMKIEDELPPTSRLSFTARLIHDNGQVLNVKCSLIEQAGLQRNRFKVSISENQAFLLRTWILENPNQTGFE